MNRKINKSVLFTIKQGYILSVALFVFILFSSFTSSLGIVDIKDTNPFSFEQTTICNNCSYGSFNVTYATWAYNQTGVAIGDGSYNLTYAAGIPFWYNYSLISYSTYNSTYAASIGNASWNKSYADTLYSSKVWGYNQTYSGSTYNLTYANGIPYWYNYSLIQASTYNATYAVYAYNQSGTAIGTFNITYQNWNKSYADTLYSSLIWGYNQTWTQGTFNSTYAGYGTFNYNHTSLLNASMVNNYGKFWYNMSDGSYNITYANGIPFWYNYTLIGGTGDGSYNATYALWAYNQTGIGLGIKDQHTHAIQNITAIPNCGASEVLTNRTGVLTCVTDQTGTSGTFNITYQNWNKTYADTLYSSKIWNYNQTSTSGGINIFNQDLNTTNTPVFSRLTIANISGTESSICLSIDGGSTCAGEFLSDYIGTYLIGTSLFSIGNSGGEIGIFNDTGLNLVRGDMIIGSQSVAKWLYNQTYSGSTFNSTYATWAYNQTTVGIGTFNITYQNWNKTYADTLYSSKIWNYNQTYSGSTFNSSYAPWAYNQTYSGSTYNSTYAGYGTFNYNHTSIVNTSIVTNYGKFWYNYSSIPTGTYNSTYAPWAYNQTYSGSTFNSTYALAYNNGSYLSTLNTTYATYSYNQSIPFNGTCYIMEGPTSRMEIC